MNAAVRDGCGANPAAIALCQFFFDWPNGLMFSCSVGMKGVMYAVNAATGEELWHFAPGGSCLSGAAISTGQVFWGSGYSNFGSGTPNNKLYAFSLPD